MNAYTLEIGREGWRLVRSEDGKIVGRSWMARHETRGFRFELDRTIPFHAGTAGQAKVQARELAGLTEEQHRATLDQRYADWRDTRNVSVTFAIDPLYGLISDAHCQRTDQPITDLPRAGAVEKLIPDPRTGELDRVLFPTISRVVAGDLTLKEQYLRPAEQESLKLYHAIRYARQNVASGHSSQRDRLVAHVAENVLRHARLRRVNNGVAAQLLGPAWWKEYGTTPDLNHFVGLLRAVAKAARTPEGSIESPYYDDLRDAETDPQAWEEIWR